MFGWIHRLEQGREVFGLEYAAAGAPSAVLRRGVMVLNGERRLAGG
jgi:hypothetical protein